MKKIIVWFRRDLRLYDNPALSWAVNQQAAILPIYIHSAEEEAPWAPGAASRWWLHHSLQELEARLAERGLVLHYFRGDASDVLPVLARNENVHALASNRLYEPHLDHPRPSASFPNWGGASSLTMCCGTFHAPANSR